MIRLLFISDFTEQFAYKLLKGIMDFSSETEPWTVWKMSPATKRELGMRGVVEWAKKWKADVVIGQFEPEDDLSLLTGEGIVVFAQDYKQKFRNVPNITADYIKTGKMAARYYLEKGFKHFAFFGFKDHCWSYERHIGFHQGITEADKDYDFSAFNAENIDKIWFFESEKILEWLRSLPKPLALFACDDNQASMLLEIAREAGFRVPDDISILGVDNDKVMCELISPSLSSVDIDIARGGYLTAMQAVKMIHDQEFTGPDICLQPVGIVSRASTSVFATTDVMVTKALDFIRDHADQHINVRSILAEVPISRRLLEVRFKEVTGVTLYKYISMRRIELFADLLTSTKDTINEIALKLDEPDVKSISRRFKAIKGCTPSEYREQYLRK